MTQHPGEYKGILNPDLGKYVMVRQLPITALQPFVEFFYEISWDLPPSEEQLVETLPAPVVHLIFRERKTEVFGPIQRRFTYLVRGRSCMFGCKFLPGVYRILADREQDTLRNQVIPAELILGEALRNLAPAVIHAEQMKDRILMLEEYLIPRFPSVGERLRLIKQIFLRLGEDGSIFRVSQLASSQGMTTRALQRLFKEDVGVSPKWVIQLFRLREAVEKMEEGRHVDLSQLALGLGYVDQAHFSNHFKRVTGKTPHSFLHRFPS